MELEELKRMLGLRPLPMEGGLYFESYRSDEQLPGNCLPRRYNGARCFGTAIYFLLTAGGFSAMHRLTSDEVYHFYLGDPVEIFLLRESGAGETITIGSDLVRGMRPQAAVPRGVWQGSRVKPGGSYGLLGTTVSPGFEFADFELANRQSLLAEYPTCWDMIRNLTRE